MHLRLNAVSLLIILTTAVWAGACASSSKAKTDTYGEKHAVMESADHVTVELTNLQFEPQAIRIKRGTMVTWVNKDAAMHNVSQIESAFLSQDELKQGDAYNFTFVKPGTYRYQCTFHHPNMNGAVIVEE